MVKYENQCCECATPAYPCRGRSCPLRSVPVYFCDKCDPKGKNPLDDVYEVDGVDLCENCLKEKFKKQIDE